MENELLSKFSLAELRHGIKAGAGVCQEARVPRK